MMFTSTVRRPHWNTDASETFRLNPNNNQNQPTFWANLLSKMCQPAFEKHLKGSSQQRAHSRRGQKFTPAILDMFNAKTAFTPIANGQQCQLHGIQLLLKHTWRDKSSHILTQRCCNWLKKNTALRIFATHKREEDNLCSHVTVTIKARQAQMVCVITRPLW